MSKFLLSCIAVAIAAGLTACTNTSEVPSSRTGYWPEWKEQDDISKKMFADAKAKTPTVADDALFNEHAQQPQTYEPVVTTPAVEPVRQEPVVRQPAPRVVVQPAPRVVQPAPRAATGGTYTVQRGDSMWTIARRHYGQGIKWKEIAAANPNIDPNRLQVGQKLTLPSLAAATATGGRTSGKSSAGVDPDAAFK